MVVNAAFDESSLYDGHSEISLEMTFDAGHRIVGHKGKCARLHGHTYKVHIMVAGKVIKPGFVVDFGDLKDLVNEWDHRLLLWDQDPLSLVTYLSDGTPVESSEGVVRLPFNPTAELMAANLAYKIHTQFKNLDRVMVELWETPKSMARALR
jgi:6-pyruvoyltetrahydropterin/6-carboxytetrahydropterin synthase